MSRKVYIATPVNGRKEKTLERKLETAYMRVVYIKNILREHFPDDRFCSVFDLVPFSIHSLLKMTESEIMGICVKGVMDCDAIVLDTGWRKSKGCNVEKFVAETYGKEVMYYEQ